METADLRRRIRGAIDEGKKRSADRRARVDDASRRYDIFLEQTAVPAFHAFAQALTAEGHRFKVLTPGRTVRLQSEFAPDDAIELDLETDTGDPAVVVRATRGRGRRGVTTERSIFAGRNVDELSDDDVCGVLLEEIIPFVER